MVGRALHGAGIGARVDAVARRPATAEVVPLEVAVSLTEPEQVEVVVHDAVEEEDVEDLLLVAHGVRRIEDDPAAGLLALDARTAVTEVSEDGVPGRRAAVLHPVVREARRQPVAIGSPSSAEVEGSPCI